MSAWNAQNVTNATFSSYNANNVAVEYNSLNNPIPICYYVDVDFNANGGTFDGVETKTVNGETNQLYRTENLTAEMVNNIGTPERTGYQFVGWSLKQDGGVDDVLKIENGYLTITKKDTGNTFDGVEDGMTLYAEWTQTGTTATVAIGGINNRDELIKEREYPFTVTVTPNDDTGAGKLNFTLTQDAELWYKDATDNWTKVENNSLSIDFSKTMYQFKLVPTETGDNKLTVGVQKDGMSTSNANEDSVSFTVREPVNAAIAITPATVSVETDTEQQFTITVTANDDAAASVTAQAGFTGPVDGLKKLEYELNGTWVDVTDQSLELNISNLQDGTYRLRATFAVAGSYELSASLTKADNTVIPSNPATVAVTAKQPPAPDPKPNPGEDGGNTNPGGDNTKPNPDDNDQPNPNPGDNTGKDDPTPKRKLDVADGTITKVVDKDGKDITDTITKDADGKYEIPTGATVTITAKDAPEGMKFGEWTISDKNLLGDPDVPYTEKDLTFTMPDNKDGVSVSVVYLEESIGEEPNLLEKGAVAGTVIVGSAALLYQGHMLGTELYLRYLLPHWAIIPQNRAELAVLLWQDAGNPEPVSTALYSDISDEDSAIQQAARWAVENDLLELLDEDEHPDHFDPFVPVTFTDSIHAWKKAQELKK